MDNSAKEKQNPVSEDTGVASGNASEKSPMTERNVTATDELTTGSESGVSSVSTNDKSDAGQTKYHRRQNRDIKESRGDDPGLREKYRTALEIASKRRLKIQQLEDKILEMRSELDKAAAASQEQGNDAGESLTEEGAGESSSQKTSLNFKYIALMLVIFLPALLVLLYTLFFYDSMYVATSTFTIKSNAADKTSEMSSSIGGMFGGAGNKDLFTAMAYIQSLDMFYALDKKIGLTSHYTTHDIVSSLAKDATQSEIEDYWKNVIEVKIDSESELMQLEVRAYSPEYSQKLSQGILSELDTFINNMNDRMTQDSIRLASIEVDKAKKDVEAISDKIRQFRDQNTFIDPTSEASNLLSIINNLENLITQAKAELAQKRAYLREDSVDIVSLKNKISSLEQEVSSLRSRIAQNQGTSGTDRDSFGRTLTRTLSQFEQLNIEYQFAQKVLEAALNNLETTRQMSLNKSKYLVTIDNPKIPDESLWPRPFLATIVTFIVTLFLLSAVSLLISAIKEHLGI